MNTTTKKKLLYLRQLMLQQDLHYRNDLKYVGSIIYNKKSELTKRQIKKLNIIYHRYKNKINIDKLITECPISLTDKEIYRSYERMIDRKAKAK